MRPTPLRGSAFEAFVAPARRRPGLWRLMLGLALALLIWLATVAGAAMAARAFGPDLAALSRDAAPAEALLIYLASFVGLMVGVFCAAGLGLRRPGELIGPGGFNARRFGAGALFVLSLVAVSLLLWVAAGDVPIRQRTLGAWLHALPLVLALLLIQTAAEELLFRGYLLQGLAARFRSPVIWLGLPAILFGSLHWSPAEQGLNAGLVVAQATLMGLILGDVTARTGNLSLAMGMHFANNAAALLLIADPGPLSGLALYLSSEAPPTPADARGALLAALAAMSAGYGLWLGWNHRSRPR